MNSLKKYFLIPLILFLSIARNTPAASESEHESSLLRVYEVNKKVCDFPDREDFSTPEAAYATINQLYASGDQGFWRRVSAKELAQRMSVKKGKRKLSKTKVHESMNTEILEVRVFDGKFAYVLAKLPYEWKTVIDCRSFELEGGRWLNAGNDVFGSMEKARRKFDIMCGYRVKKPTRQKVEDPEEYLRPYVEFLKINGKDPHEFVLEALREYKVVIIGETHHRPRYWAFNSSLVAHPDFAKQVGTIYMELPSNDQALIDKFLAGDECDTKLVIKMLRHMLWMGWPDKPMLDFFVAVWKANQNLKPEQRMRIVLVDMERPWEKIQSRDDWRQYDVDRDKYMAENIVRDIQSHPEEKRNTLFIVGVGHTSLNFAFYGGHPLRTAGWHLREKVGEDKVYAITQHRCVMTNMGRVDGRLCLGLFDSAFAKLDNRPMAFTLEQGPFGEQAYDGQPDVPVWSKYREGFNAYLYLGPLKDEIFSPLIQGFYTDEFVKELDRRYRMMFGRGWEEQYRRDKMDAETFIQWMSGKGGSWGNPRKWRNKLGPINAWKYGDEWQEEMRKEKHKYAMKHPEEIEQAAAKLFEAIRNADYERHRGGSYWQQFPGGDVEYQVHHHADSWVKWICKNFAADPIESLEVGKMFEGEGGRPAVDYTVTLQSGRVLKGVLPFEYLPRQQVWMGVHGIDWHLQYPEEMTKEREAKAEPIETETEQASVSVIEIPEASLVDRSGPEATVRSWTKAVATGNVQDALACMLPGGADYEDVKKILNAKPSSPMFFMRKMWESIDIDKPARILGKTLIEDEATIGWEFYFKEEFTIEGRTFKPGDGFEFDATLKKHGDYWLIDNI